MRKVHILFALSLFVSSITFAETPVTNLTIPMYKVQKTTDRQAVKLGEIVAEQTKYGVLFKPKLNNIPPGVHGFHVHEKPSCGHAGKDAGGHLDPRKTGKHQGPFDDTGHLGDLPVLVADKQGDVKIPVIAPRLTLNDLRGHSVVIHLGSDNYSDEPEKLGGGGARYACGIVRSQ